MKIQSIRIYAEVLEQGLDFKEYVRKAGFTGDTFNIYTKKGRNEIIETDSLVDRIRKCKDVDVMITAISDNKEIPLLMVEYSTAVPADDHRMQRSDVYYWGSVFRVPILKICPKNKGMAQAFGGGGKISNEMEAFLAYQKRAIYYFVEWNNVKDKDILETKQNALSCIYYSEKIDSILKNILQTFQTSFDFNSFYDSMLNRYYIDNKDMLTKYSMDTLQKILTDSSRFKREGTKLINKINRFGHGMDPDRGVLYFSNMINGFENVVTEIQINRNDDLNAKGGYAALFDATPHKDKLIRYVQEIIHNKKNIFSDEDALKIFKCALNIEEWDLFSHVKGHEYCINDDMLLKFLKELPGITSKCMFFLSSKLILTDKNRKLICSVSWNKAPVETYLHSLVSANLKPLQIQTLSINTAKEDIITFASVELYKKLMCDLIAVSYPGAQGDRCILVGNGRNVKRIYTDIIALKKEKLKTTVFLEECKENIKHSKNDVEKLHEIIDDNAKFAGLKNLVKKVNNDGNFNDVKISIGAKASSNIPYNNIDYIFMFDLSSDEIHTYIDYSVALIDVSLIRLFSPLLNSDNKLIGRLTFEKLYIVG